MSKIPFKQNALKEAYREYAGQRSPQEVRDLLLTRAGCSRMIFYKILPALRAMHAEAKRDKIIEESAEPANNEPAEFSLGEIVIPADIPSSAKQCITQYANAVTLLQSQLQQSRMSEVVLREQVASLSKKNAFLKKKASEFLEVL